ncbi:MAG: hypothetical protein EOO03_04340 [Chitinophagaceae bacterium]|nr:MAG: hypothetical protein EOO03_04340 [Chitinophagaceae bacterium]
MSPQKAPTLSLAVQSPVQSTDTDVPPEHEAVQVAAGTFPPPLILLSSVLDNFFIFINFKIIHSSYYL